MNAAPLHDTLPDSQEMLALLRKLQADSLQALDQVRPSLDQREAVRIVCFSIQESRIGRRHG